MIKKYFIACFTLLVSACSAVVPAQAEIKSFEECVKAGNPIRKSLPAQCISKDGVVYIDPKPVLQAPVENLSGKICKDLCGDGQCQEMVCMAVGCPCPESPESCPKDCGK